MFTDIVGFTALTQADEALALSLLERHHRLLRPIFPKYQGREVKTMGDSFLVEFDSALDATSCSVEIQRFLREYNLASKDTVRLQVRIGIHLGDVVHSNGDVLGDAVNIASRIEPLAEPSGVCVSQQVFDQIRNKVSWPLEKLASHDLKNVQVPIDVYKLVMPWEESEAPAPRAAQAGVHRLAVLPFTNMSPDPQDEFFADGLTEEMITELSRNSSLQVIARTSVMRYKGTTKSVKEVGRELNVDVALEGSVRKAGNTIRITSQLIDTASEAHLWAERFDRELTDIFAVQTEIAQNVAGRLGVRLGKPAREATPSAEALSAYLLYLRGRFLWHRRTLPSVQQALRNFEEAVAKDPRLAPAYSGIADCYMILANNLEEIPWSEAGPKALAAARTSLDLDGNLAEAHASLGLALVHADFAWGQAEREFQRAIALNPSYAPARVWYFLLLGGVGRFEEARSQLTRASEIDPLSVIVMMNLSAFAAWEGRTEEALRYLDNALELEPGFAEVVPQYRVPYLMNQGRKEEALAALRPMETIWAGQGDRVEETYTWVPGSLLAIVGREDEARRSLERLLQLAERSYVPAEGIARVYAALGEADRFFEWHERGLHDHSADPFALRFSPILQKMRADPRFPELYRRFGIDDTAGPVRS